MYPVAETIFAQLGGNKFVVMTGASSFSKSDDTLTFRLPSRSTLNHIGGVRIKYEYGSDTYTVTFLAMRGLDVEEVKVCTDVYNVMLCEVIEIYTGLRTSL